MALIPCVIPYISHTQDSHDYCLGFEQGSDTPPRHAESGNPDEPKLRRGRRERLDESGFV
jgi:hypothetical protein